MGPYLRQIKTALGWDHGRAGFGQGERCREHTAGLGYDLHRRGLRSGPDLAQIRAHTGAPCGLLVPHHQTLNTQYQRKLTPTSP